MSSTDGIDDSIPSLTMLDAEQRTGSTNFEESLANPDGSYGDTFLSNNTRPKSIVTLRARHYTSALIQAEFAKLATRVMPPPPGTTDPAVLATYGIFTYTILPVNSFAPGSIGTVFQGVINGISTPRVDGTNRYSIDITLRRTDI